MNEKIQILGNKKYIAREFIKSSKDDIACNHCAFELGKCRGAIWALGQCYITNGKEVSKNIYYEEVKELVFA
jgi:hypothetical protein